ncbi:MAG: hypothetical protein P4M11_14945 [Candidatus Pacebacteria bacterium]|nr:hypothetical protein [Candidatus Paceibacterota bacterium]
MLRGRLSRFVLLMLRDIELMFGGNLSPHTRTGLKSLQQKNKVVQYIPLAFVPGRKGWYLLRDEHNTKVHTRGIVRGIHDFILTAADVVVTSVPDSCKIFLESQGRKAAARRLLPIQPHAIRHVPASVPRAHGRSRYFRGLAGPEPEAHARERLLLAEHKTEEDSDGAGGQDGEIPRQTGGVQGLPRVIALPEAV